MSFLGFDPCRLDVTAFAKAAGELDGEWLTSNLRRLAESSLKDGFPMGGADVHWSARGELRPMRGAESQVWLHVKAAAELPLECQRCLKAVDVPVQIDRHFLFVHGEDTAAQLDTNNEDDVLALTRELDLRVMIEDEMLLALPIVPRHEVCPKPLVAAVGAQDLPDEKPNPFAVLKAFKRRNLN